MSVQRPAADAPPPGSEGSPVARGRPRSERARAAILAAAGELLIARGLGAASMDAVAECAGVSKATIYRWWPSKEALALDALYEEWAAATPTRARTLRGELLGLLRPWVRLLATRPYGRVVAALAQAAREDPVFAQRYLERFIAPRREAGREILERARQHGELRADVDVELALDLLYGPIYHRLLHGHAPLSQRFVEQLVDAVLSGLGAIRRAR